MNLTDKIEQAIRRECQSILQEHHAVWAIVQIETGRSAQELRKMTFGAFIRECGHYEAPVLSALKK